LDGWFLKGGDVGEIFASSLLQSGIFIPTNGKALVKALQTAIRSCYWQQSQNKGTIKGFFS